MTPDPLADPLAPVLAGTAPPGVLAWPADRPLVAALEAVRDAGWVAALVELDGVTDKAALMESCARGLELPDWFGGNWDALADCLGDLSWWPAGEQGRVIVVRNWQSYAAARPKEWVIAQEVFADAAEYWRSTPTGLVVLVALGADAS
jgi:hypothetical protein